MTFGLQRDNIKKKKLLKVISNLSKICCTEEERSKADTVTQTETEAAITQFPWNLANKGHVGGNGKEYQ